jgi:hypothetical protein
VTAKLAASLPNGEGNGLAAIAGELVDTPEKVHVVVALVDCSKITTETDSGDIIPTARIRRIEAINDSADGHHLRKLLRRQYERRTGKTVLPFELEEDLRAAFGDENQT